MKKINENTKVTLTFGQLKRLVKETIEEPKSMDYYRDVVKRTNEVIADFQKAVKELYDRGYVIASFKGWENYLCTKYVCYIGDGPVDECREEVQSILDAFGLSSKRFSMSKRDIVVGNFGPIDRGVPDYKWACRLTFPIDYSFDFKRIGCKEWKLSKMFK